MAWQDSLAWARAQDPRWVVVFFLGLAALWLVRRVRRFWRERDDLWLVMGAMAAAFPLGAILLARSIHGDARSRRIFFAGAAISTLLYLAPLAVPMHPVVFAAGLLFWGGVLTAVFAFTQKVEQVAEARIEDRLHQLGLAALHHIVAADGRKAVAIDTTTQTVIMADVERSFPQRAGFGNVRSVDVFVEGKPVENADAIVKGPVELRITTDNLTEPTFVMLLAKAGRMRERELTRVRKDAIAWRVLLRKLRTRSAGAQFPLYLRELHTAGVINDLEYRSLLDRAARI